MNENALIILGMSNTGMNLLRETRKYFKNIYCLGSLGELGLNSKYGKKVIIETIQDVKKIIEDLELKYKKKPMMIITSDYYLSLILSNEKDREVLKKAEVLGPDVSIFEMFNNKETTYEYAESQGINTPKTYDFKYLLNGYDWNNPIIFKWNTTFLENKTSDFIKTKVVNDKKECEEFIGKLGDEKYSIIAQEYLDANFEQYSYGGLFLEDYEKMGLVVKQLQQYPKGVSSMVEEIDESENITKDIKATVKTLLKNIDYKGFIECEFRYNIGTNKLYLIDVNPRTWGWFKILFKRYKVVYKDGRFETYSKVKKNLLWLNVNRFFKGDKTLKNIPFIIKKVINNECSIDEMDLTDNRPMIKYILKVLKS